MWGIGTISKRGREKQAVRDTPGGLRIVYGLGAISGKDTKSSIQRCQIITGRRMEKAVQKATVNWEVNNCVYNWTSDRKTGRFATANEVKSVTSHEVINNNIEARDLFNAVLADINRFADMAVNDERAVRAIEKRLTETDQSRAKAMEKEQKKLNKRLAELDRLFSSLYEDKVMERITERNFEMMSGKYQKEQLEIEARLKEVTETLNESYEKSQGIRDFLSLIRNYQGLKELDATVVNALIDKILVSEREKSADGTIRQEIKIYYKFIGFVGELHITPTKRWTALPAKHCTVCGVEYVPGSGISKYCPACAKKIQREHGIEGKRRSRERKRQVCIELSAKNDRLTLNSRKVVF